MQTTRASAPAAEAARTPRPPYLLAALAGLAVFALYAATLAPTTATWDTSEYISTAHILGIPHPPGNPLFVLLARSWELLLSVTGLPTAVRINLFSAFMSAASSAFWYLVVHRILGYFTEREGVRRIGAAASVLVSATAFTVWNQSNVNEKVYTVSFLTIAFVSWMAFLWRDHVEEHGGRDRSRQGRRWHDDNVLVLMIFLTFLSSEGNHRMALLVAPALLVLVLMVKARSLANWRLYAWSVGAVLLAISVQLFLPVRSAQNPVINEAAPVCSSIGSAYESVVHSVFPLVPDGCQNLSAALSREQYQKPPVTKRMAPFADQMATYFQYFDWQWSRSLSGEQGYFGPKRLPITLLFLGLGLFGAWQHWKRDRKSFAYLAVLFVTLSFGLAFYMNFKYGYGQVAAREMDPNLAEVRERDYFFLISFSLWGLWAGLGITALWLELTESRRGSRGAELITSPVLALALVPLALNWSYASRRGDTAAHDLAYNLLQSVEPYGVLFTNGDNDTFPLWYLQEVEGVRRDVTVIVGTYLNTDWYPKQLRDLTRPCPTPGAWAQDPTRIICQRPFDPRGAPSFYGNPRPPSRTMLPMTDAQIDVLSRSVLPLSQDVVFEARGIQAPFKSGRYLTPSDQLILTIIKESWGDRPIFFATTGAVHRDLGLDPYVARQGLAYKLVTPEEAKGLMAMPQNSQYSPYFGAYFDLARNRELVWKDFRYGDLVHREHWTDDATRGFPTYYASANMALAQAEGMVGNQREFERNSKQADQWMALASR
ncbi:MAG: DUF2723 domain-containing protein [Gemmatimonadetes bacterium]|nr:DUF2723 domain-containing protein [Gemmatimonadota bacterium]